ncbi:MAG: non-canonical purine NTP pyrophosphatase, RdgB/HAM1 family [Candidatus Kerfeldbacteria bacterium CG08_land_8_20_14_0_20_40_16]|uniref:dITP/XTP pyrophosphatase n=1 Tax=Candidatus Kerfeldbacteria bacterium CG08_land_8_20_14_0_20_40_16 TaxID=2014244 RepID=A0A2H0YW72_9BACT|nr:MAG: non-canonical purine NTP pyrophosphatase, RdgB/HAM1 family [Candidatus Kerfeldbacteria bacterium CG08_land_8_20_14_0_20_40_16]
MKLIFASHNPGKVKEIKELLRELDLEVLSANEAGITEDIVEDGKTLEENALKKSRLVAEKSGEWAMADDTGLFIKALDNAPGVHSHRWAGENTSDRDLIDYTLGKLKGIPKEERKAYFKTVVVLYTPEGRNWIFSGKVKGQIAEEPTGKPRSKLPYDLIFIPKGEKRTFAEMSDKEKNSISHRGVAFKKLKEFLAKREN